MVYMDGDTTHSIHIGHMHMNLQDLTRQELVALQLQITQELLSREPKTQGPAKPKTQEPKTLESLFVEADRTMAKPIYRGRYDSAPPAWGNDRPHADEPALPPVQADLT